MLSSVCTFGVSASRKFVNIFAEGGIRRDKVGGIVVARDTRDTVDEASTTCSCIRLAPQWHCTYRVAQKVNHYQMIKIVLNRINACQSD